MRLRSSSKHEPFVMLCNDHKGIYKHEQFKAHGGQCDCNGENKTDSLIREHLCGWACSCFLTQMNFLIAGVLFVFVLYVLAETTDCFENITTFFTGMKPNDNIRGEKSVERFFETHYL